LGDKGIVNGKMSTSTYILTGYGPTPPSFSLAAGRKHNQKDIKLVEALSLVLIVGAVAETLILSLRHLK
jgi:hypothetical protein